MFGTKGSDKIYKRLVRSSAHGWVALMQNCIRRSLERSAVEVDGSVRNQTRYLLCISEVSSSMRLVDE